MSVLSLREAPLPTAPHRALVVSLRFLGDALLTTPVVRALKQRYPECAVDALVFRGTEGVFDGNPDVRGVIGVPEFPSSSELRAILRSLWRRYDLALVTQPGTRPHLFGWAAGRYRVGLVPTEPRKAWWKKWLTHRHAPFDATGARVLENQRLARMLGIEIAPVVVPPSAGEDALRSSAHVGFDVTRQRFAVVHATPRWAYKRWTDDGWRALIAALAGRGLRVVLTGGGVEAERAYLDRLLAGVDPASCVRIDGRLSFGQTADLLRHAALYVGPDTATTHLAAACATPTLALYGPTDPHIWGPWPAAGGARFDRVAAVQRRGNVVLLQNAALDCVPCQLEGCDRHRESRAACLDELSAQRVIEAAHSMLDARAATGTPAGPSP